MNILLTISYCGTNYCGWQNQKNGVAVQQRIEEALSSLFSKEIKVTGASRTDSGVHAYGQRAMFTMENAAIPLDKLPYAVNSRLPDDITVTYAESVPDGFHPIFSAKRKTYEYRVLCGSFMNPLLINQCCFIKHQLDLGAMREAGEHFVGEHDFEAFCASGASTKTSVRTIYSLNINDERRNADTYITMRVCGNGFLYNMVRIIAGTLIYVGEGKIGANDIPSIINSRQRECAGKTAPPHGLVLMSIEYN